MSKEYIDREALLYKIRWASSAEEAVMSVRRMPAADVVEVVRCKDCKYYAAMVTDTVSGDMETATWGTCRQPWFNSYEYDVGEDGFCNCGARMDKEAE